MNASDLPRLAEPFPADAVDWKPGATTRDKKKGLAMAYLTSRAIQQRFDDVCGPADWRNEFREGPGGGVLCGISVRVERTDGTAEWVTKWDGSDNSQVEAVKGGLSGSMKRAAVQWGVGRYLYDLPATWVRLDDRGRFAEAPQIPRAFLPAGRAVTLGNLIAEAERVGLGRDDVLIAARHYCGVQGLDELDGEQRADLVERLRAKVAS